MFKDAELAFKKEWVAPGFAQIRGARQSVHLLFFMKEATRARVGARQDSTKCTREQEYAPPADLPEDCLSLFTDGSAMYDKDMKCWVSAGFGFVAVKGGETDQERAELALKGGGAFLSSGTPP